MYFAARGANLRNRFALLLLCLFLLPANSAFARRGEAPYSVVGKGSAGAPVVRIDAPDVDLLMAEDELAKQDGQKTFRYALPTAVSLSPSTDGVWQTLGDGTRLWQLEIAADKATDLNLGFERFRVPLGAKLWVISATADYYEGPYTYEDNEEHSQLWVPLVPGGRAIVELQVPAETKFEPEVELTQVGYGYRDVFQMNGLPKQGSCNNDTICPEGDPWRDQIQAVAAYSLGGSIFCTGSMIMDTTGTFRPFFLTAFHCGLNAGNAPSLTVFWNFESPTCGALSGGSLSDNQTGATFRANRQDVDMCLVELDDFPDPTHNVYYAGWDRSGNVPQGSVGIHHPNGDEKAITFNTDPLTTQNSCIASSVNTHWRISEWEDGTTEPGSSGSALFDPNSQLVVGFLSGGLASCTSPDQYDCYGKFSVAWDGGASSTRLRDWLDPSGIGPAQVQGSFPSGDGVLAFQSASGSDDCAGTSDGVIEPGETVSIAVNIDAFLADVTGVSGLLTSSTAGVTMVQDSAVWPDVTVGSSAVNTTPFVVSLDPTVACFSTLDFDLVVSTLAGGNFPMSFSLDVGQAQVPSGLPLGIPDGSPAGVTSTFVVGESVPLTDLDVAVQIDHTWVGDLTIRLRNPSGTEVTLLDRPGVPTSTYGCSDDNLDIVFDDGAAQALEDYCAASTPWYSGSALPTQALSAFNGQSTAGTWTLIVSDSVGQDSGQLLSWELITTPGLGAGECDVCDPGPATVLASSRATGRVSVTVFPDGSGTPLSAAWQWDEVPGSGAVPVDATIDLQVLTGAGAPVAGYPAGQLAMITSLGGLQYCGPPLFADADTAPDGTTTLSGAPEGGGFTAAGELTWIDAGPVGVSYPVVPGLEISFNSPDFDANGIVDLIDIGEFSTAFLVAYDYSADFVWDGLIDLKDIGEFALGLGKSCQVPVKSPAQVAHDGARIGLYFDSQGRERTRSLPVGEAVWANVMLSGDLAAADVRGWEAGIRASSNVVIHEWVLAENTVNVLAAPQFAVGTGAPMKAASGDMLPLARVRLSVTDEAPAYLYVDARAKASLGAEGAVVLTGRDEPRLWPLAQDGEPVAAINGELDGDAPRAVITKASITNVPNPFNPATELRFAVPQAGRVEVKLYDLSGRLVRRFDRGQLDAGEHSLRWNGRDQNEAEVVSGVYFARLFVDGQPAGSPRKMSLLK